MKNRTVSIVFLFFAALATAALGLALALSLTTRIGAPSGPWLTPVVTFVSLVGVFFLARALVLPPAFAASAAKAFVALSAWMGVSLAVASALSWAARPLLARVGFGRASLVIVLGCILAFVTILDRVAARDRTGVLP